LVHAVKSFQVLGPLLVVLHGDLQFNNVSFCSATSACAKFGMAGSKSGVGTHLPFKHLL
jgi:hypothetical protein